MLRLENNVTCSFLYLEQQNVVYQQGFSLLLDLKQNVTVSSAWKPVTEENVKPSPRPFQCLPDLLNHQFLQDHK